MSYLAAVKLGYSGTKVARALNVSRKSVDACPACPVGKDDGSITGLLI